MLRQGDYLIYCFLPVSLSALQHHITLYYSTGGIQGIPVASVPSRSIEPQHRRCRYKVQGTVPWRLGETEHRVTSCCSCRDGEQSAGRTSYIRCPQPAFAASGPVITGANLPPHVACHLSTLDDELRGVNMLHWSSNLEIFQIYLISFRFLL